MALKWPAIPEPGDQLPTLIEPLRALKNLLEMVTGQRTGAPVTMARIFKTDIRPGAANSTILVGDLKDADLWIDTANNNKLRFWNNATQVWIPTT